MNKWVQWSKLLLLVAVYVLCANSAWDYFFVQGSGSVPSQVKIQKDYQLCSNIDQYDCHGNSTCLHDQESIRSRCHLEVDYGYNDINNKCAGYLGMLNSCLSQDPRKCAVQNKNFNSCVSIVLKKRIDSIHALERGIKSA